MRALYMMAFVIAVLLGLTSWSWWKIARLENAVTVITSQDYETMKAAFDKLNLVVTDLQNDIGKYEDPAYRSQDLGNLYNGTETLHRFVWETERNYIAEIVKTGNPELLHSWFKKLCDLTSWHNTLEASFAKYKKNNPPRK